MPELERMLAQLGRELDWPDGRRPRAGSAGPPDRDATPPQAGLCRRGPARPGSGTGAAARAGRGHRRGRSRRARCRARSLGLQGATVERRTTLPTPPPERPLDLGAPDDPGERPGAWPSSRSSRRPGRSGRGLCTARACRAASFRWPTCLGPACPARSTRLGLLVSQFRGDLDPNYIGKVVGPQATAEELTLGGEPAIWIEGAPHFFFYRDPDGQVIETELAWPRTCC